MGMPNYKFSTTLRSRRHYKENKTKVALIRNDQKIKHYN